jgi:hypothetical protein
MYKLIIELILFFIVSFQEILLELIIHLQNSINDPNKYSFGNCLSK